MFGETIDAGASGGGVPTLERGNDKNIRIPRGQARAYKDTPQANIGHCLCGRGLARADFGDAQTPANARQSCIVRYWVDSIALDVQVFSRRLVSNVARMERSAIRDPCELDVFL